jgi:hypothetical protein
MKPMTKSESICEQEKKSNPMVVPGKSQKLRHELSIILIESVLGRELWLVFHGVCFAFGLHEIWRSPL